MEGQKTNSLPDANEILDKIIAATFTRHAELTDDEFLKAIGIENPKDEDTEVRNARFALIAACAKESLKAVDRLKLITQIIMVGLGLTDEDVENFKKRGKKNG